MSEFVVKVVPLANVETHPNADRLELAVVGDYRCVVQKGKYKAGDLVAYIPEQSILPPDVIDFLDFSPRLSCKACGKQVSVVHGSEPTGVCCGVEMDLKPNGFLAGKDRNRVKALRLRGYLSQGICYPARPEWTEGQDVTEILGITKYVATIPACMAGEVFNAGTVNTIRYDIENVKAYPDILVDGEEVVFTEKIHGTWTLIGVLGEPHGEPDELPFEGLEGRVICSSKGLSAKHLAFKLNERNQRNIYLRVARELEIPQKIAKSFKPPVFVIGETFGRGVQDLDYGHSTDSGIGFRVFDIYIGLAGSGRYLNNTQLNWACKLLGLERVPILYRGPFSKEIMLQHTLGKESVSGKALHIREGIVIRPVVGRYDDRIGRVQLKSVSEDYLLRKGDVSEHE